MNQQSVSDMELQRRAFGQYLNYLVNQKAKGTRVITLEEISIDAEIKVVSGRINDLKKRLATEKSRIEA